MGRKEGAREFSQLVCETVMACVSDVVSGGEQTCCYYAACAVTLSPHDRFTQQDGGGGVRRWRWRGPWGWFWGRMQKCLHSDVMGTGGSM